MASIRACRAFVNIVAEEAIAAEPNIADARKRSEGVHAFTVFRTFCAQIQTLVNISALETVSDETFVTGAFK
jgi:hypothetical protein